MSAATVCSAARRALVIGLGEYEDRTWGTIHGDRDALLIREMLSDCNYDDITTLINRHATKQGIIRSFARLTNRCKAGDVVYIQFSGHGQQITDLNGDEDDGFDEAWVPYDARFEYSTAYTGAKHLTDDEINPWLQRIRDRIGPEGSLLVVVDACHSGDSSRQLKTDNCVYVRGVSAAGVGKPFIIPQQKRPDRIHKPAENWLTLSACQDYQLNFEVKTVANGHYGMLTYAIYSLRKQLAGCGNAAFTARLQQWVNGRKTPLPQDLRLSGLTSECSLSDHF